MHHRVAALMLLLLLHFGWKSCDSLVLAEENPAVIEIKPEQARGEIGKTVRVLMTVKAAKLSAHRKCVFLDSEEDFRSAKNLGVVIEESALQELADEGIEKPHDFFKSMELRITGPLELREDRPYLVVKKSAQIKVVKP